MRSRPTNRVRRRGRNGKFLRSVAPSRIYQGKRGPFLRSLQRYLKAYGYGAEGRREREAFAKRCGTSLAYLTQLCMGQRIASMDLAIQIEQATHGIVRAEEVRPGAEWDYLRSRQREAAHA